MGKFLSGMGLGVMAGACAGMFVAGTASGSEKRRARRQMRKAVQDLKSTASDLRGWMQ